MDQSPVCLQAAQSKLSKRQAVGSRLPYWAQIKTFCIAIFVAALSSIFRANWMVLLQLEKKIGLLHHNWDTVVSVKIIF